MYKIEQKLIHLGERKMGVLEIHRATRQALARLPSDLNPLIVSFIGGTRLDWRTCKKKRPTSSTSSLNAGDCLSKK